MKPTRKQNTTGVMLCLVAIVTFAPFTCWANCTNGVKIPAFLASGVDPNLLLIIDNSGSMNDLAYIGAEGTCYDDAYSPTEKYAGYFDDGSWYGYCRDSQTFSLISDAASQGSSFSYKSDGQLCLTVDAGSVSKFIAKGNFLNWAAASKLDIQKKILTGGKYESNALVMESRGCLGRRYVKKVPVRNSQGATNTPHSHMIIDAMVFILL